MHRKAKLEKTLIKNESSKAGKNIIQVGRDYLHINIFIGHWILILITAIIIISLIFDDLANVTVNPSNKSGDPTLIEVDPTPVDIPNPKLSPTVPSNPASPENPFYSYSFPLNYCGDKLPNDPTAYPIKLYRVFVQFSEDNLTKVKSFCKDAFKKLRTRKNIYEIQVASFVRIERATKFKEFIKDKIGSGYIEKVTVLEKKTKPFTGY